MRGVVAEIARSTMRLAHDDELVAFGRLAVVFTIDARVRHVVVHTLDDGILVGDSSRVDFAAVDCTRCGRHGHRSDTCTSPGVAMSDRIRKIWRARMSRRAVTNERNPSWA